MVQLSQPFMATGKTIALTRWTFVGRIMAPAFQHSVWVCHSFPAKKQTSDFMAAVTIHSGFRAQEEEICHYFHIFPSYLPWSNGAGCHDLSFFLIFSFKLALSLSSFTLIKRLFSSSSLSTIREVSSTYLRLLMFLLPILTLACNSSSPAFLMVWSEYSLNKQCDSRHLCFTPFLISNQSVVPYRVLSVASWPKYRFPRWQVRWSSIPICLRAFHSLL